MSERRRPFRWTRWTLLLAWMAYGCGPESASEAPRSTPPSDPSVVAVHGHGQQVTLADLDRAVLALPPAQRTHSADQTTAEWYESLVREVVIDRLLADQEIDVAADADLVLAREEIERQAVVEVYLERHMPPMIPATDEEARAFYEANPEQFFRPGRRLVAHLFKRRAEGQPLDTARSEIEALRQRILAGESFALLASQHSDSESRHRDGQLGWQTKDSLPGELAKVVFALAEQEPSAPVPTAEGVHLFWVDQAIEARDYTFDEVAVLIRQQLDERRRQENLLAVVEDLPVPEGSFTPDAEGLARILEANDPQAVVLRVGDHELRAARFRSLLMASLEQEPQQTSPTYTIDFLEALAHRERTYLQAIAEGVDQEEAVAARIEALETRSLLDALRRKALERKLTHEPEHLQTYYDNNAPRFSSPLRLEIRRLAIPVHADNRNRVMSSLESLAKSTRSDPSAASVDLEALADVRGGDIEDLGWMTLPEVGRLDPRLVPLVAELQPGQLSPPYHVDDILALVSVVDRQEPELRPMATILPQLRRAFLRDHGPDFYRQWADETLEAEGFVIFRDRLANGSP